MKQKLGFFGSITIRKSGSERLRITYRPILLWLCSSFLIFILGVACIAAIIEVPDFRIFASVSCLSFTFFGIDLMRHLGSVVELDFDKNSDSLRYRKTLLTSHLYQQMKLVEIIRAETIAPEDLNPKLCLLFNTVKPIYISLFLGRSPHRVVNEINQFLQRKGERI